jgi:hypothetical protein
MSRTSKEQIHTQQELLTTYRRTLAHLLKQRALLTDLQAPPGIMHGIQEARDHIHQIKTTLRTWGVTVEDHLDDAEVLTSAFIYSGSANNLLSLIWLLMALGVPTGVVLIFTGVVIRNPWWSLVYLLLYEVVILLFGIFAKIWRRLENRWLDQIAEWLDIQMQLLFSSYRRRYLRHLVYRHRDFDVKGLTTQGIYNLELDRVFVELVMVPQPANRLRTSPFKLVQGAITSGRFSVWDYLTSQQMATQNFVVIGPPGSGKTTLLKHMTIALAAGKKGRMQGKLPRKLPLLLFLRDHANIIMDNSDLSLSHAVRDSLAKLNGPLPPSGWFEGQLERGKCLVMLDGLDEVADLRSRKRVVEWVERQMIAHAKCRFVISSRPFGFLSNPLTSVTVLEVSPFTDDQIQRFVHNWYLANEIMSSQKDDPGVRMVAQQGAEDLLHRIRNTPALYSLAVNPLLLTMIANVHRFRSTLPGRRVELYNEICEVFLGKRQHARGLDLEMTPAQKQRVLQPLAYYLMCHQRREIILAEALKVINEPLALVSPQTSGHDFMKMIENSSGLLVERENEVYSFSHLTFQEYIAAVHAREQRLEHDLVTKVEDSWWRETTLLYVAQADATPVIEACLAGDPPSILGLTLAIECLEEAREVQLSVRSRLETVLSRAVEDLDPVWRQIVAESLLAIRLRRMVRLAQDTYVDLNLVSNAEYQLFIDEQHKFGKYYQPIHWTTRGFLQAQGRMPAVGVRPSDAIAFCKWLTKRGSDEWLYRLPKINEPGSDATSDEIPASSIVGLGYWTILDKKVECVKFGPRESIITSKTLKQWSNRDHASSTITHDFGHAIKRIQALDLDHSIEILSAIDFIQNLVKTISDLRRCTQDTYRYIKNTDALVPLDGNLKDALKQVNAFVDDLKAANKLSEQNLKPSLYRALDRAKELADQQGRFTITDQDNASQALARQLEQYREQIHKQGRFTITDQDNASQALARQLEQCREQLLDIDSRLHQDMSRLYMLFHHTPPTSLADIASQKKSAQEIVTIHTRIYTRLQYLDPVHIDNEARNLARVLDPALRRASDVISVFDVSLAQELVQALDYALGRDQKPILDRRYLIVFDDKRDIIHVLAQSIDRACTHVEKLKRDLREEVNTGIKNIFYVLTDKLTKISEFTYGFDSTLEGALYNVLRYAKDLNSTTEFTRPQILNILSGLSQGLDNISVKIQGYEEVPQVLEQIRDGIRASDLDPGIQILLRQGLAPVLDYALSNARTNAQDSTTIHHSEISVSLRRYVRYCTLILADKLANQSPTRQEQVQYMYDNCLDLYISLVILEERLEGNTHAFEGIRLVKELKKAINT